MRSMASAIHKLERSMAREFERQEKEERQAQKKSKMTAVGSTQEAEGKRRIFENNVYF